jgi:enamine deaminase RidA (YjgF/YER057c/UK114 family)
VSEIEKRLQDLDITLPEPIQAMANYVTTIRTGNLIYTSGASCFVNGEPVYTGKLGKDLSIEEGYEASRITALNLLSLIKNEVGSLDHVVRIVKVLGLVSSTDDFYHQPQVINGASDLFVQVLGEKGKHTRSALGTNVLPFNIPVEIEIIVEVK